ncbi:chemotaxis protein CheX [Candidatus Riflebacteria bacterium]
MIAPPRKYDVRFLNPFISSTLETFEKMLHLKATRKKVYLDPKGASLRKLCAQIGLSGDTLKGAVILSFEDEVANQFTHSMLGMPPDDNSDILDALGEICNMVVGKAKALIADNGFPMLLSLPIVTVGAKKIYMRSQNDRITLEFSTEKGTFLLQFDFE